MEGIDNVAYRSELEVRASLFAAERHGAINQKRKYTGEDYIIHPEAVASIVRSVPHTEEMLAAAWLHDVVEDTPTLIEEIRFLFGSEVSDLVDDLTDVSKLSDGSRAIRKAIDRAHTAEASAEAMTIKLADLIHNTSCMTKNDPKFSEIYLAEKQLLLEVLKKGNSDLWKRAYFLSNPEIVIIAKEGL